METQIKKLDAKALDMNVIAEAGRVLREGGLVAFPTETVYGLGGDALNPASSEKIYAAKGRPSDNPLIVHIAREEDVYRIAAKVPKEAKGLMEAFWPGPLTLIFPKTDLVPGKTTGGLATVAVRMPNHPIALALIKASTGFVAAPSANASGRPSPTQSGHVYMDLAGRIPMILDGGPVGIGIESTIVDFSESTPTILRPGYITKEMIQEVIGEVSMDPGLESSDSAVPPKAPGMKYRHYAPQADLILVEGQQEEVVSAINHFLEEAGRQGKKAGVIGTDETCGLYREGIVKSIGTRKEAAVIAKHLYGLLREFDELGVDIIYSESFSRKGIGQAVMNRMIKAAGHRVIKV